MKPCRKLAKRAEAQGWTIRQTRNNHTVWVAPCGTRVYAASTPSDHRAWRNHLARMRRAGYRE